MFPLLIYQDFTNYILQLVCLIFPLKSETQNYELAVFIYNICMDYLYNLRVSGAFWVL